MYTLHETQDSALLEMGRKCRLQGQTHQDFTRCWRGCPAHPTHPPQQDVRSFHPGGRRGNKTVMLRILSIFLPQLLMQTRSFE